VPHQHAIRGEPANLRAKAPASGRKRNASIRSQHAEPGQSGLIRCFPQHARDQSRAPWQARAGGDIAVTGHAARRYRGHDFADTLVMERRVQGQKHGSFVACAEPTMLAFREIRRPSQPPPLARAHPAGRGTVVTAICDRAPYCQPRKCMTCTSIQARPPVIGRVRIHAQTMRSTTVHLIALRRLAVPTPMMAADTLCVVDTGMPSTDAVMMTLVDAVSAATPLIGCSLTILWPSVRMMRQPPAIVPAAMTSAHTTLIQTGIVKSWLSVS